MLVGVNAQRSEQKYRQTVALVELGGGGTATTQREITEILTAQTSHSHDKNDRMFSTTSIGKSFPHLMCAYSLFLPKHYM